MITNEVQYQATRAHAARFEEALRNLDAQGGGPDEKRRRVEIAAVRSQLGDLEAELAEYEQLRSGTIRSFEAGSLPELAVGLVKARIAKGWSQRRLAEELGVAQQQIQRYESTGYTSASLARLCDVVAALGVVARQTG
ncbi:MAG: helix-turn-helix domain-containing protein [Nocardioidaceae bacterium]